MKRFFCLLALIIISEVSLSQDSLRLTNSLEFYVMPFSLIPYTPRIRVGAELNFEKYGYSLDVGLGRYAFHERKLEEATWNKDYFLIEVRPEIKKFIKNKFDDNLYLAGELFFTYLKNDLENGLYYSPKEIYYESSTVHRIRGGINIKAGHKLIIQRKVLLDFYYGVGLILQKIYYTDVVPSDRGEDTNFLDNSTSMMSYWFHPKYKFRDPSRVKNSLPLNITLGIKMGLIFWND